MSSRVALALPFYASIQYVDTAMQTLVAQDYNNYKIFAVSDGASEDLFQKMISWYKRYPDLIKIFVQENMGTGAALNRAFDEINKEGGFDYGTMVSADNLYEPNFISALVLALDQESDKTVMTYGDFIYIDANDKQIGNEVIHENLSREHLVDEYKVGPAFLFRMREKNKAGLYWRRICEDYTNAVMIGQFGGFKAVNKMLVKYRLSSGQLTGSNPPEEMKAAEYCRRLARKLYFGEDSKPEDVYPSGVDPFIHRYDEDILENSDGKSIRPRSIYVGGGMKLVGYAQAKNELRRGHLVRFLENFSRVVDEFVIYDDGSDDGSQEIYKKYTPHVIQGPGGEFAHEAKMSQTCLDYCRDVLKGDWCIWQDCDAIFDRATTDGGAVRKLIDIADGPQAPMGGWRFHYVNTYLSPWWQRMDDNFNDLFVLALFKLLPSLRFDLTPGLHRARHPEGIHGWRDQTESQIIHLGFSSPAWIAGKYDQYKPHQSGWKLNRLINTQGMILQHLPTDTFPTHWTPGPCDIEPSHDFSYLRQE